MKRMIIPIALLFCLSDGGHAQQIILSDGFESGRFDTTYWKPQPSGNGAVVAVAFEVQGFPCNANGFYGVAMGRNVNGAETINILDLHLDLSSYVNRDVDLSFWIKDYYDDTSQQDGIWFSDNGGVLFKKVFQFDPSQWSNNLYGQVPPVDIDRLAADSSLLLTDKFVIRFQQSGNLSFTSGDGFFIDDVVVSSPQIVYAALPFMDDFETGGLGNSWRWANPTYPALTTEAGTVSPGGFSGIAESIDNLNVFQNGFYGLALCRKFNGAMTTNAIDLHLDLSAYVGQKVELNFWVKDYFDDTQAYDGIWFSHDGGESFRKVHQFDPSRWSDNLYGQMPPLAVDELASINGLSLTNRFVIRFQQYGFLGVAGGDGIFLDNVTVTLPTITYAALPFSDGFESGRLENWWHRANPLLTTELNTVLPGAFAGATSNIGNLAAARTGSYGLAVGRLVNSNVTTSAVDLHLNLAGYSQVELKFWIKDYFDETNFSDGIWFSNDGGVRFRKVLQFDPSMWPNNVFREQRLDLDSLAASVALLLTDRFVIRFQQQGFLYFEGGDGFLFDDFTVTGQKLTAVDERAGGGDLPESFALSQNHPNPFNPSTRISFALPSAQKVTLKVFDLTGKEIATLLQHELKQAGLHEVVFDAKHLPSGVYPYCLQAGEFVETKRMVLIR